MVRFANALRRSSRKFGGRTDGSATIEAVLWFPVFIIVFGLMVDAAMIFHHQAQILRLIQDTNRNLSIGRFQNDESGSATDKAENFIEDALASSGWTATATTTITAGIAHTDVEIAANQLQILGFFESLNSVVLNISAEHMIENWEA